MIWVLPFIVFAISWVVTAALCQYTLRHNLLDVPNPRSSHTSPTPRGGGVAVVVAFAGALVASSMLQLVSWQSVAWFAAAGVLVAGVGFVDDHGHVDARWRLLAHFIAGAMVVYSVGELPEITVFGTQFELGWPGRIAAVIGAVWLLNLYNFMDGIDGIAGVEAVTGTVMLAFLLWLVPEGHGLAYVHLLLAAAVMGMLLWNFPPAKMFMGDVGSGFIGLMLAALLLSSAVVDASLLWSWLIMLGVFVVDSTYTLMRRLLRGDKVYQAHRSHAYQYASRQCGRHLPVTLAVLVINVVWLAPIAYVAASGIVDGFLALLIAYFPLVGLAVYFKAGKLEESTVAT